MEKEVQKQLKVLLRGAAEVITREELEIKIRRSLLQKTPLKVKLGLDPTAPDLHLGHTVVLQKLRQFQELGHEVILIIGDFTGRVGDPTGKQETRPQLTEAEIKANAATYTAQVFRILDPEKTKITFNSQWLATLTFAEVVELASKYTVARMLEREDFNRRFKAGTPIGVHEFFYPLMQGYDSVALRADVELGGTDQKFNLLMGRTLQKEYGQEPQVALMTPILEGRDGVQKMSKSLGNYIGISEPPEEIYGKIMSLPDALMLRYFELVTKLPPEEIDTIKKGLAVKTLHPRDAKMRLAKEIVTYYHGKEAALKAEREFQRVFQAQELPEKLPTVVLGPEFRTGPVWLPKLLVVTGLSPSTSEAKRLIRQGAVRINALKVDDPEAEIEVRAGMVLQIGKRKFARLVF